MNTVYQRISIIRTNIWYIATEILLNAENENIYCDNNHI